jgi:hypothetical protein
VFVGAAADLWKVSRGGVHYWIGRGLLPCFGQVGSTGTYAASLRDVLAAKVLLPEQIEEHGIEHAALERALAAGVVLLGEGANAGRLSLNDLEMVRRFNEAASGSPPRKRFESGVVPKPLLSRRELLLAWVEGGAHAHQLPDEFFDTPEPPEPLAPAGVFLFTIGDPVPNVPGARFIRRSRGHDRIGGKIVWCEQDDRYDVLNDGESLKPEYVDSNYLYWLADVPWVHEWSKRQRRWRRQ